MMRQHKEDSDAVAGGNMLYMVIERFKNGDIEAVATRFRERGRLMPDGLSYVSSWLDEKGTICYQLMETGDRALLDDWISNWSDLVDFEVVPVMTSTDFWQNRR